MTDSFQVFGNHFENSSSFDRDTCATSPGTMVVQPSAIATPYISTYWNKSAPSIIPPQPVPGSAAPLHRRPPSQQLDPSSAMRTFRIRGPFGVRISLAPTVPGTFSISFPNRAHSEPGLNLSTPQTPITLPIPVPVQSRQASLAPTEIEEPSPEEILATLTSHNIKVRDFGYGHTQLCVEIFNQYRGIAEHDFRLEQYPRSIPINGKTLRRLLDLGWVGLDEAKARWHQMDWDALAAHDARPGGAYPWRPLPCAGPLTQEERAGYVAQHGGYFLSFDRIRKQMVEQEEEEEREAKQIELMKEAMRARDRRRQAVPAEKSVRGGDVGMAALGERGSKKRVLEGDLGDRGVVGADPKRQRFSVDAAAPSTSAAISDATRIPMQQFPAPLKSYDPELYPLAASIIESRQTAAAALPLRADTPPIRQADTPPVTPPVAQVPQARAKKGLGRTQTCRQL